MTKADQCKLALRPLRIRTSMVARDDGAHPLVLALFIGDKPHGDFVESNTAQAYADIWLHDADELPEDRRSSRGWT